MKFAVYFFGAFAAFALFVVFLLPSSGGLPPVALTPYTPTPIAASP